MAGAIAEVAREGAEGVSPSQSPARERLREQIAWYDRKSELNQRWFKRLKVSQIVVAAAIPVIAGRTPTWLVAAAGALIAVVEGLQQLQQYQQNWTSYRATCEQLKHERFLFEVEAGPYAGAEDSEALLAERVESLVSQEHTAWVAQREEAAKQPGGKQ